jgi:hypothetical protein
MSKQDGGPAFPFGQTDSMSGQLVNGWGSEGMTLRDYFAAKASEADIQEVLCSHIAPSYFQEKSDAKMRKSKFPMPPICIEKTYTITRQQARYMHADAMLKEREK